MRLKKIKLLNFRNYDDIELEFSPNINIMIGENGAGKTNILEAIYVLSLTKSNRYGTDFDLIKSEKTNAKIEGEVLYDDYSKWYQIDIDKSSKKVYINKAPLKKISEYIGSFCVTAFLPNDIEIIKGAPSIRRNILNIQIGQLYNNYLKYMNEYNSLLKMRNEYLKRLNISALSDIKYLDILNLKMQEISVKIYYFRFFYVSEVNKIISGIFKKISGLDGLCLEYVNNLGIDTYDEEKIKNILNTKWHDNLNKELMQGMTLFGLHRDDLIFKINGLDAKIYASQGQQRLVVIAYKIAELLIFQKIKGEYPVLLLDDVFSEIDIKKRNKIIKYLNKDLQVIITTTDLAEIDKELVENARVFNIKKGVIKNKGGVRNGRRKSA